MEAGELPLAPLIMKLIQILCSNTCMHKSGFGLKLTKELKGHRWKWRRKESKRTKIRQNHPNWQSALQRKTKNIYGNVKDKKAFIGGDGTNGNAGINWTGTVGNDAVIDLDNQWLRSPISDAALPSVKLNDDATSSLGTRKHPGLAEAWRLSAHFQGIWFHVINQKMYRHLQAAHAFNTHNRISAALECCSQAASCIKVM